MIPEDAVEAAARAVFLTGFPEGCGVAWDPWHPSAQGVMRDIRIALEAAAPHLASGVLPRDEPRRGAGRTMCRPHLPARKDRGQVMIPEAACTSKNVELGSLRCADCGYPVRWNLGDWTHEWPTRG